MAWPGASECHDDGIPPAWASAWGEDEEGLFAAFSIGEVEQIMRWIPAGTFVMGSPEDEPGRTKWEGPQHEVTISEGFWLADTPCTQAMWEAVMGTNPSSFKSAERPVENVNFDDVASFLAKVQSLHPELELRLPSEAEWEYACRAGTKTATYAGPIDIVDGRAPILDEIAWYRGNSDVGVGRHEKGEGRGTRRVKEKRRNPWGLFDMLGNVWEWCADGADGDGDSRHFVGCDYSNSAPPDPYLAPGERPFRVVRGGAWYDLARYVRAAYRYAFHREVRYNYLGFRVARGRALVPGGDRSK